MNQNFWVFQIYLISFRINSTTHNYVILKYKYKIGIAMDCTYTDLQKQHLFLMWRRPNTIKSHQIAI